MRLPRIVRLDCGLQKPSLESDVGTAKYGSRDRKPTYFATSSAFPLVFHPVSRSALLALAICGVVALVPEQR